MVARGLEGVIAGTTQLSSIIDGTLTYHGIDIDELAEHALYEEVIFLFYHGRLPTRGELAEFQDQLAASRALPDGVLRLLQDAPSAAVPMDLLRTAVSALAFTEERPNATDRESSVAKGIRLVAQVPTIVATIGRLRRGLPPVIPPMEEHSTARSFLMVLHDREPDDLEVTAMNRVLVLHADHEFNASTFAARVTAATLADMHAAITAAIAALKGPLHGGANAAVMQMLEEIGAPDRVEPYILEKLGRHERIMGFGHRVYKGEDPRAKWLRDLSRQLGERAGDLRWYELSTLIAEVMQREKGLHPNVDFYAASVYHYLGIDKELMTPVFAASRISGWTAHVLEQQADNRLIRPRAEYTGPVDQHYVPLDQRG
ncbi:citrate synthase [Thermomicrobiaceae bacterium CFH 74404]|uniref:Citrate synthase n=1 Tax=Thermalbibacter longus TaxID=2951981 RepID=A0AA41WG04_9BACT|nr:citrate/2-methylcitrate synthase [Thermalbibacter longus]MCM8749889.1 citrate synthase [Thermalbibacter longus]